MQKMERLGDLLDVYQFSLGSIAYCVDKMRSSLEERGGEEAVALADEAHQKTRRARRLQYDWDQKKKSNPLEREGTQELDNRIDSTLGNLLSSIEAYADIDADTERTRFADELVDDLFPSGVFPITSKPFDDEHTAVNELLQRLEQEYAEHVEQLSLEPIVDHLEELNTRFGERLEPDDDGVEYDEVQSAYVEAEDAFHRLVVRVMSNCCHDTDELNDLLRPVLEQTERTRRALQTRGVVPEVDPETGEPVETEGEPISDGGSSGDGSTDGEPTDSETDEPTDSETDDPSDSETDEPTDG